MRRVVRFVLAVLIFLVAAWLGLWWYAEGRMQAGINNWAEQMAANGNGNVRVSYDSLKRGTSPLAATVALTNLQVTAQSNAAQTPVSVTLPSLVLRVDALDPLVLHVDWPQQVNLVTSRANLVVTFGSIQQTGRMDPHAVLAGEANPFSTNDIAASNVSVLASGSLLILHLDGFTAHAVMNRTANASQTAISTRETIDGIALSPLLTQLASVPFHGKIAHIGLNLDFSGPVPPDAWRGVMTQVNALPADDTAGRRKLVVQAVHDWAAQGGSAKAAINLVVGPSALDGAGTVKFDANAQPSGSGDVTANHLDAFSAAIARSYPQLQGPISAIEAELSPYLSSSDTGGQTLAVHATYGAGAVSINGQKVADMPPLNWANLENPPPPPPVPAQAPGDGSGAAMTTPTVQ